MSRFTRWLRFNAVGLLGIGVQVGTIAWLVGPMRMDYRLATILGVVAAVVHNFAWHWRWTWATETRTCSPLVAFALFAAANGAMSLAGNVLGMSLLVGVFGMPTTPAALVTIAACGIGNFFAADGIFRQGNASGRALHDATDSVTARSPLFRTTERGGSHENG